MSIESLNATVQPVDRTRAVELAPQRREAASTEREARAPSAPLPQRQAPGQSAGTVPTVARPDRPETSSLTRALAADKAQAAPGTSDLAQAYERNLAMAEPQKPRTDRVEARRQAADAAAPAPTREDVAADNARASRAETAPAAPAPPSAGGQPARSVLNLLL
jgi:hypothetical protein